MPERGGVQGAEVDGVFFTESQLARVPILSHVDVAISRQNANLTDVKKALAVKARAAGGNAVMRFQYGQRAHPWYYLLALKWDSESWHGSGDVVRLDPGK